MTETFICALNFRKYAVVIAVALFISTPSALLYATSDEVFEKGSLYSAIAFKNSGDAGQYEKALQLLDRAINELEKENLKNPDKADNEKLNKWKNTRESVQRFYRLSKTKVRNRYPLLHHFKTTGLNFDMYKKSELISIINILKELNGNTEILRMERPLFITVIGDKSVAEGVREEAFQLIEEAGMFHTTGQDNFTVAGRETVKETIIDTYRKISVSEGFSSLLVFYISDAGDVDGFRLLKGTIYKTDGSTVQKVADSNSFGYNTYKIEKSSYRHTGIASVLALLFVVFSLLAVFRIDRYSAIDSIKQLPLVLMLFLIGAAGSYFLGLYYYEMFTPMDEVGSDSYYLIAGAALAFMILIAGVSLITVKFEGAVVIAQNRFYLSILFCSFFLGVSIPMFHDQVLFSYIYHPEFLIASYILLPVFAISGVNTGSTVRGLYKALYVNRNSDVSGIAWGVLFKTISLVMLLASQLFILSIAFERNLAGSTSIYIYLVLFSLVISLFLFLAGVRFRRESDRDTENLKSDAVIPVSIDDLKKSIKRPLLVKGVESINTMRERLAAALDADKGVEGGILYLYGKPGSGLTRYSEEIARLIPGATVINIKCEPLTDDNDNAYRCFIDGLSGIRSSRINAIKVSRQMSRVVDRGTRSFADPLSMIPVAGGLLSWLFSSDTSGMKENSDYRIISKKLSSEMLGISRRLVESGNAMLIFVVDDFQNIDDRSIELMDEFIRLLNNKTKSGEKNPVAFILCGSEVDDDREARRKYERLKALLKGIDEENESAARFMEHEIKNVDKDDIKKLIMFNLNFAPAAADVIMNILSVRFPGAESYSPKDVLGIIEKLIDENHLTAGRNGFEFRSKVSERMKTIELLEKEYMNLYDSLSFNEKLIISNAAAAGAEFELEALKACLANISRAELAGYLNAIERECNIIRETGAGLYSFSHEFVREIYLHKVLKRPASEDFNSIFYTANAALFSYYSDEKNNRCYNIHNHAYHAIYSENAGLELKSAIVFQSVRGYIDDREFEKGSEQLELFLSVNRESIERDKSAPGMLVEMRVIDILSELVLNNRGIISFPGVRWIMGVIFAGKAFFIEKNLADFASLAFNLSSSKGLYEEWNTEFCREVCRKLINSEYAGERCIGYFWLANVHKISMDADEWRDALSGINTAEEIFISLADSDEFRNRDFEARIYNTKGDILVKNGKQGEAIEYFKKSILLKEELKDNTGLAMSHGSLSSLYMADGHRDMAIEEGKISYSLNAEINNRFGIYLTSVNLAELYISTSPECEGNSSAPEGAVALAEGVKYLDFSNAQEVLRLLYLAKKISLLNFPVEERLFLDTVFISKYPELWRALDGEVNYPADALKFTKELKPDHYNTLLGERPSGSRWGRDLAEEDLYLFAERAVDITAEVELPVRIKNCRYYRFDISDICPDAVQNYVFAGDIATCYIQEGAHGPELVSKEVTSAPVTYGHIITGPVSEKYPLHTVYTLYPGPLSQQPDPQFLAERKAGERITREEIISAGGMYWPVKGI